MAVRKRGLGKGLSDLGLTELLGEITPGADSSGNNHPSQVQFKTLPVHTIKPGRYQPRRQMCEESLQELAASIRSQGIIQPIVIREINDGYEIIAGERRWRAAQLADMKEVPVIIRNLDDESALAVSLIENIQRQDLNVMEEAVALQRLIDEFNMTHQELALAVGKSRASVTNILRLLKLNDDVRSLVEQGHLDMGHARALLALEGARQSKVANIVVARALSVRDTERLIRKIVEPADTLAADNDAISVDATRLQENLSTRLGAKVTIRHGAKGKGKLVIHYKNADELDGILDKIQ
jgi:ParB family chromosome partitioning protein